MAKKNTTARPRVATRQGKTVPGFRAAAGELASRSRLGSRAGITYGGKRDLYEALGYKRSLAPADYRERFDRNAVAARIIEAKPQSTWRGGGVIIENETPDIETPFETAYDALNRRLNIWSCFQQVDILAGFGHYAIILIGAPGKLDEPLKRVRSADDILYLQPYSEADAPVATWDNDPQSARFGQPVTYNLSRPNPSSLSPILTDVASQRNRTAGRAVHFSRVIHIADGLLDDRINGIPRLERCWNLLDDLDKVTGGGAEAFWRRADAGLQVDVDPEMELEPPDEAALDDEIDDYVHGLRRVVRTRGVKMNPLTSAVAGIKDPIDGIMSQLSAGTGIPQRILMGSERGQLASTQDDDNWTARIADRRKDFAGPMVVIPTLERLVVLGALPPPAQPFEPRWPEVDNLDDLQKATVAGKWAVINKDMGEVVVLPNEIRDRLLGLPPLEEVADPEDLVIEGEIVEEDQRSLPEKTDDRQLSARTRRVALFKKKWACMSFHKRLAYLQKNFPEQFPKTAVLKRVAQQKLLTKGTSRAKKG
jgi:hypothetical protein